MINIIEINRKVHDSFAEEYDECRIEINNPTEQDRISEVINKCQELLSNIHNPKALDFGAGTGNLTKHLLDAGFNVTASDISEKSLVNLKNKFEGYSDRLSLSVLNGKDLYLYPDNTFDFVGTYSVLHHVTDYLEIVREIARITKIGGLIYIDHEVCPDYWNQSDNYKNYRRALEPKPNLKNITRKFERMGSKTAWKRLWYRYISKNRISSEGDIHIFPDDHIEWEKIEARLSNCNIVLKEDYLVCRERELDPVLWKKWNEKCADMRTMILRKVK